MKIEFQGKQFSVVEDYAEAKLVHNSEGEYFLLLPGLELLLKIEACTEIAVKVNGRYICLNELKVEKRSGGALQNSRERQRLEESYFAKIGDRSVNLITDRQMILRRVSVPLFN